VQRDLPEITVTAGQALFSAWPVLTLAAAVLRLRGAGPRDWLMWTSIAAVAIPAAMVALAFF